MGLIADAAATGDQMTTLVALRDYLADRLDGEDFPLSGRDVAPTANALTAVLEAIEDLKSAEGDPETDQIVGGLEETLAGMNVTPLRKGG